MFERTFYNRFMSVFRFDDEEEAHFLTRWEITPYPCVPTFHVTQDCPLEKKKKKEESRRAKTAFSSGHLEIVAV